MMESLLSLRHAPCASLVTTDQLPHDWKDKVYTVADHRKMDSVYSIALKHALVERGAVPEKLHSGKPNLFFIHAGTPLDKIPGLAYRRFCYPETRFIMFGSSPFIEHSGMKDIWSIGELFGQGSHSLHFICTLFRRVDNVHATSTAGNTLEPSRYSENRC